MNSGPKYKVAFRRKREQKTDYNKRLKILKSNKNRFVVNFSNNLVRCQIIEYHMNGDKTILSHSSKDLKKLGWNHGLKNTSAIYLTAYLLANNAKKKGIKNVVLDFGARNYKAKTKIFAALKAISDASLECVHDKKAYPSEDRITGKTINDYLKNNIDKDFLEVKKNIENN